MGGMGALVVVEGDPAPDASLGLRSCFPGVQVDAFILQGPPEALDEDVVEAAPLPLSMATISSVLHRQKMPTGSGRKRGFAGDVPDEAGQFTGNSSQYPGLWFSRARQVTETGTKAGLRLPADIADLLRQVLRALEIRLPFLGRMPV